MLTPNTPTIVPRSLATCPECGGTLEVRSMAWDAATGAPIASDLQIECKDDTGNHRWWQSMWQPVVDTIRKWAGVIE
jgi:hypothetical protein